MKTTKTSKKAIKAETPEADVRKQPVPTFPFSEYDSKAPARKIAKRAFITEEGVPPYTLELLECGHTFSAKKSSASEYAYQRKCPGCASGAPVLPAPKVLDAAPSLLAPSAVSGKKRRAAPKRAPRLCLCGCGGMTKGGLFLMGHDAKMKSKLIKGEPVTAEGLAYAKKAWPSLSYVMAASKRKDYPLVEQKAA